MRATAAAVAPALAPGHWICLPGGWYAGIRLEGRSRLGLGTALPIIQPKTRNTGLDARTCEYKLRAIGSPSSRPSPLMRRCGDAALLPTWRCPVPRSPRDAQTAMEPCTAARLSQPPLQGGGVRSAAQRWCPVARPRPGPVPSAAGWRLTPSMPLGLMQRSHPRRVLSARVAGLRGRVQAAVLPPLQSSVEAAVTAPSFVFHVAGGGKVCCYSTRCAMSWTGSRAL
jgi:hypothetical protein